MKNLFDDKTPPNDYLGQWISVEIECLFPNEDAYDYFTEWCESHALNEFVTIKEDCSIETDHNDQFTAEIVVTFRYNNWGLIRKISKKLRELKTKVNTSCGLHVHFDCRHLEIDQANNVGHRIAACVPALKKLLPKSRRNNYFCNEAINDISDFYAERYTFVNMLAYNKYKTIEIRGHSGTIDATKIINWVILCKQIMRRNRLNKRFNDVPSLIKEMKFNSKLNKYLRARNRKFSRPNVEEEREVA